MSDPRIWSDSFWGTMHRGAIAYPEKPTDEDKEKARQFFNGLSVMIPCPSCSMHFKDYFKNTFNDKVLESSEALQRWVFDIHCAINDRLKIANTIKFEDLRKLYNSFPSRYVDMDSGRVLQTPRFRYNYGVSQPADEAPRQWLVENIGKSLDDRSMLAQIFTPLGEKQEKRSKLLALAVGFILTILVTILLTNLYHERKEQKESPASKPFLTDQTLVDQST